MDSTPKLNPVTLLIALIVFLAVIGGGLWLFLEGSAASKGALAPATSGQQ